MRKDTLQKQKKFSCTAFKKKPPLVFFQQTWAEVVDIAQIQKYRPRTGSWQEEEEEGCALSFEVHRSLCFPCLLVSSQELTPFFKTNMSTSKETPPSSYVQEKRAATQLSPTTTFLWTPSPPLTTTPQNEEAPIKRRRKRGKKGKQRRENSR